jgi:hypothetical protein
VHPPNRIHLRDEEILLPATRERTPLQAFDPTVYVKWHDNPSFAGEVCEWVEGHGKVEVDIDTDVLDNNIMTVTFEDAGVAERLCLQTAHHIRKFPVHICCMSAET